MEQVPKFDISIVMAKKRTLTCIEKKLPKYLSGCVMLIDFENYMGKRSHEMFQFSCLKT